MRQSNCNNPNLIESSNAFKSEVCSFQYSGKQGIGKQNFMSKLLKYFSNNKSK